MRDRGWEPGSVAEWNRGQVEQYYGGLVAARTTKEMLPLAAASMEYLYLHRPDTVRGNMYLLVNGPHGQWLPDTSTKSYDCVQRLLNRLRMAGVIPFSWVVDNVRSTIKPSSWSGLNDFAETVADAYRLDFWSRLDDYIEFIVEKDTVAGKIAQVTRSFDVPLHPIRGYNSTSYAYEIASRWREIHKPITIYYLGDHDPSGRDLERDIKEKLAALSGRRFLWQRLAVEPEQFGLYNIRPMEPKQGDSRFRRFVQAGYYDCAEVEAIPAKDLRHIVHTAILTHIPTGEWERLQEVERLERQQWLDYMAAMFPHLLAKGGGGR
jgi:hypothetical protein